MRFAIIIIGIALILVVGGIILLQQNSEQQPAPHTISAEEEMVLALVESLPDIMFLKSIPLQENMTGVNLRIAKRPDSKIASYTIELWEDFTGEFQVAQRYHYLSTTQQLMRDHSIVLDEFETDAKAVLNPETGEVLAGIGNGVQENCDDGSQRVLNACAGASAHFARSILDIVYQRIIVDDLISLQEKEVLSQEQETWIIESKNTCDQRYESGGSIDRLEEIICYESATRERIDELFNRYLDRGNFYKVTLTLDPGITEEMAESTRPEEWHPWKLGNHLAYIFGVQEYTIQDRDEFKNAISLIAYDITEGNLHRFGRQKNNIFNRSYYVEVKPEIENIDAGRVYSQGGVKAMISKVDSNLFPFIKDQTYCTEDSDCSVGHNICSYGAHNKFRKYTADVFGCPGVSFTQEDAIELIEMCDPYTHHPAVEYSGASCIENTCVGLNRVFWCAEGGLP